MKKILLIGCLLCGRLSAQTYQFETAATSSGGISTATARQNTGWTSDGTTAQDTLAPVYLLDKANIRFIVTDTDGDTLWFYPQNLHPFVLKDGTSLLSGIDSTGRGYFGGNATTTGQTRRAFLNVVGTGDTLLTIIGDGNRAVGDSSVTIDGEGRVGIKTAPNSSYGLTVSGIASAGDYYATSTYRLGGAIMLAGSSPLAVGSQATGIIITPQSGQVGIGASGTSQLQAFLTVRAQTPTADTLLIVRNDKNSTLDSTAMVFADGSHQFGVTAGGTNAFSGTAEHDTVAVTGASVNDIYTVTIKGAAAPAAADLFAVEALATGFAVHRSAAGTSGLEYYWRRERR